MYTASLCSAFLVLSKRTLYVLHNATYHLAVIFYSSMLVKGLLDSPQSRYIHIQWLQRKLYNVNLTHENHSEMCANLYLLA